MAKVVVEEKAETNLKIKNDSLQIRESFAFERVNFIKPLSVASPSTFPTGIVTRIAICLEN